MQFPITIGLHRSHFMDALVLFAGVSASVICIVWPGTALHTMLLFLLVWLIAGWTWYRFRPPLHSIRLEKEGRISARVAENAGFEAADLLPGATVHPWLTVFRLKLENGRVATVIFTPQADFRSATVNRKNRQILRKLRVFLRWQSDLSDQKSVV